MTRQAVFLAIKKNQLKGHQEGRCWYVYEKDLYDYRSTKYSREKSKFNGQSLYKKEDKELSIRQASKLFGVPEQHVYYLVRIGRIPSEKRSAAVILKYEECLQVLGDNSVQMKFA